jgi:hypothetical protein
MANGNKNNNFAFLCVISGAPVVLCVRFLETSRQLIIRSVTKFMLFEASSALCKEIAPLGA